MFLLGVPNRNYSFGSEVLLLRVARLEARIAQLRIGPTQLTVQVDGVAAVGTRLEIVDVENGNQSAIVGEDRRVEFAFAESPHQTRAMLLLSRDGEWLDHRHLGSAHLFAQPDVVWEYGDIADEIGAVRAGGEGQQTEFKEGIPAQRDGRRKMMRTLAAFANAAGGIMLVGVEDDGTVVGIRDPKSHVHALTNLIRSLCTPEPPCQVSVIELDGKHVIVIRVDRGPNPPYGVQPENPTYHVRRGATTFPATPHEVRSIVQRDQGNPTLGPSLTYRPPLP